MSKVQDLQMVLVQKLAEVAEIEEKIRQAAIEYEPAVGTIIKVQAREYEYPLFFMRVAGLVPDDEDDSDCVEIKPEDGTGYWISLGPRARIHFGIGEVLRRLKVNTYEIVSAEEVYV